MAKTYSTVFADSAAKMYADTSTTGATIVPMSNRAFAAALSTRANFLPGPGAGKGKFEIQRKKRIKRHAADASAKAGDRILARLNAASKRDWDTVEIVPAVKYDFLVNVEPGDIANFSTNPSDFTDGFEEALVNTIVSNEEDTIEAILADPAVVKISLGDQSAADLETLGEKVFDKLALTETNVSQLVDDYAHMSNTAMHVSKYGAKALKAFKGTMFHVDSSRYADDIVPNFTFTNSEPGLVNTHFDKFTVDQSANGGVADEKIVAIVMKDDAVFDSGYANNMNILNTKLLDEDFNGHSYWGAMKVIDPARIIVITAKTPTTLVKKVNA